MENPKMELKRRKLPEILLKKDGRRVHNPNLWADRREEIIETFKSQVYGFSPDAPSKIVSTLIKKDEDAFAGKAVHSIIDLGFDTPKGHFSFPINLVIPKLVSKPPLLLHIAFRPEVPDKYYPVEEIIDGGFATASFYYEDITADKDDGFKSGLGDMYTQGDRKPDQWGKISMWAWSAQRVMDYIETLDDIDTKKVGVIGHSRLGKTALWCAAQDERFFMGVSNESGSTGAAISRGKKGERVGNIVDSFGYWFCENYKQYSNNEENMPFDQHFLLGAMAPRYVYVGSAIEDTWCDPESEFLSCMAAGDAYELFGFEGLVSEDKFPKVGDKYHKGHIGYHLRGGSHYLSRYDWQGIMEFINSKG